MEGYQTLMASGLVRSYSNSLKDPSRSSRPSSPSRAMIEQSLSEEVDQEDYFSEILRIAASSQRNSRSLKARCKELDIVTAQFEALLDDKIPGSGRPKVLSWDTLAQSISHAKSQYERKAKKGPQIKRRFHAVCEVMQNHSNMLKILPQGDMYTSLLSGSVDTIVQASVNHEQVGEQFAVAWKEIDRTVATTRRELTEFPEPFLLELGVELCCKILEFVTSFFSWYTQKGHKRFLASFNEGLSKDYQPILDEVRQISSFMQRGFQLCMVKNERRNSIKFERYFKEVERFQQKNKWSRDEEQWKMQHRAQEAYNKLLSEETRNYLATMSQQLAKMLVEPCGKSREADRFVAQGYDNGPTDGTTSSLVSIEEEHPRERQCPREPNRLSTKAELDKASRVLDPFFDYNHIDAATPNIDSFIEVEVVQRLQSWNTDISSSILGICGPDSISQDGPARLVTLNFVRAAHAAGIPCISFFCEKSAEDPPENRARETIGTVAMLYALIQQLIMYLPLEWSEAAAVDKDDFEALGGTLATWVEALSVFRKLLGLSKPPVLLIVIYGLQDLDHNATKARLGLFLDLLRDVMSGRSRIVKALLVTAGISEVVYTGLKVDEMCDVNRGSVAHSPGRARKGRASMGGVKF